MPVTAVITATLPVEPKVWRRLRVPLSATFSDLHAILQLAFGWNNSHCHRFIFPQARGLKLYREGDLVVGRPEDRLYGGPVPPTFEDARKTKLSRHLKARNRFLYHYDYGDDWVHVIKVGRIENRADSAPVCLAGGRACPPEDSGGPHAYEAFVEAYTSPKSKSHKAVKVWLAERNMSDWDPEAFTLHGANISIAKFWGNDIARRQLHNDELAGLGNNLEAKRFMKVIQIGDVTIQGSLGPRL